MNGFWIKISSNLHSEQLPPQKLSMKYCFWKVIRITFPVSAQVIYFVTLHLLNYSSIGAMNSKVEQES